MVHLVSFHPWYWRGCSSSARTCVLEKMRLATAAKPFLEMRLGRVAVIGGNSTWLRKEVSGRWAVRAAKGLALGHPRPWVPHKHHVLSYACPRDG